MKKLKVSKKEYQTLNPQINNEIKNIGRSLTQIINQLFLINVVCVSQNTKGIRHGYKSKHNITCKNEVILLMITDGITSNHKGDF